MERVRITTQPLRFFASIMRLCPRICTLTLGSFHWQGAEHNNLKSRARVSVKMHYTTHTNNRYICTHLCLSVHTHTLNTSSAGQGVRVVGQRGYSPCCYSKQANHLSLQNTTVQHKNEVPARAQAQLSGGARATQQ